MFKSNILFLCHGKIDRPVNMEGAPMVSGHGQYAYSKAVAHKT